MPMLAFMPWLRLRESVRADCVFGFPMALDGTKPEGVESSIQLETVRMVLSQYMIPPARHIGVATVLLLEGKPLGSDFDEVERAKLFEFGQHLAVAGMSTRRFSGGVLDDYTATGHYQVIIQSFNEPFTGSMRLTHRRKDGQSRVMLGYKDVRFWLPDYLVSQGAPQLDLALLSALRRLSSVKPDVEREVRAACSQYLLANSDSPDVSLDVLTAATYTALERVSLASSTNIGEIKAKLLALLAIVENSPWTGQLRNRLEPNATAAGSEFKAWLQKLYELRGEVAHGKAASGRGPWSQDEHLLAGAFVLPLALKCLLSREGLYPLTEDDVADVLGLDGLLGARPFFVSTTAEEDEFELRERSGWLRQMGHIADGVIDLRLRRTLEQQWQEVQGKGGKRTG